MLSWLKNPRHQIGDFVGLNQKFRNNVETREKVDPFFGPNGDQTRQIHSITKGKAGWYYIFQFGKKFPVEWFDESRRIPRGRPIALSAFIIAGILVPIIAALIQRPDIIFPPMPTATSIVTLNPSLTPTLTTTLALPPTSTSNPTIQPTLVDVPGLSQIAFVSLSDEDAEIYVMDGDGSNIHKLTNNIAQDYHPTWSPDGRQIAFDSDRNGSFEIYLMNANGSNQRRLTNLGVYNADCDWSPDGRSILFTSSSDTAYPGGVYVIDVDGSNLRRVTNLNMGAGHGRWSPDGNFIVFIGDDEEGIPDVFVINPDGTNLRQVTDMPSPAWDAELSPDGKQIAFTSNGDIYVVNVDGTNLRDLASGDSQYGLSWSPDGRKIIFGTDQGERGEPFTMNADGSDQRRLGAGIEGISPNWRG